jgi:hypothetical protein
MSKAQVTAAEPAPAAAPRGAALDKAGAPLVPPNPFQRSWVHFSSPFQPV